MLLFFQKIWEGITSNYFFTVVPSRNFQFKKLRLCTTNEKGAFTIKTKKTGPLREPVGKGDSHLFCLDLEEHLGYEHKGMVRTAPHTPNGRLVVKFELKGHLPFVEHDGNAGVD